MVGLDPVGKAAVATLSYHECCLPLTKIARRDPRQCLRKTVIQKLRHGRHPCNQQMIPSAGAGDVEQVTLGIIRFVAFGRSLCHE